MATLLIYKKARELHDEIKENKIAKRKIQKWELKMTVGSEQGTNPMGENWETDTQEKPPVLSCLRDWLGTLGGEPAHSTPLPDSFYFKYFTLETNLSKRGYLKHTHSTQKGAGRGGL